MNQCNEIVIVLAANLGKRRIFLYISIEIVIARWSESSILIHEIRKRIHAHSFTCKCLSNEKRGKPLKSHSTFIFLKVIFPATRLQLMFKCNGY